MWRARPDGLYIWGQVANPQAPGRRRVLWWRVDTGATWTVVDPAVLASLGLQPVGSQQIVGVTGQPVAAPVFAITLLVPEAGALSPVAVLGLPLPTPTYQGLLGDNVLRHWTLTWVGPRARWRLTGP